MQPLRIENYFFKPFLCVDLCKPTYKHMFDRDSAKLANSTYVYIFV